MKLPYRDFARAKDFRFLGLWSLLSGPEHRLKREALARLREEAAAAGGEPAWESLDGAGLSARDLVNRCQTGGLFGEARVLVVQGAERIPRPEQERLAKEVGRLPAEVAVVLVTAELGERSRRAPLGAALQRALEQQGLVIEFPAMNVAEAARWAVAQAKARGKALEPAAARKLAEHKVGTGLAEIESEVEKLCLFVGDAPQITSADLDEVTPRRMEEAVSRLVDAVGQQRAGRAAALVRGLVVDQREDPSRLLGLLAHSLRLIWQAKLLLERGWRPGQEVDEETASLLPQDARRNALTILRGRSAWQMQRALRQANAFSWDQLSRAIGMLLACDLALKGIQGKVSDPALALELLVVQLCAGLPMPVWEGHTGPARLG